MQLTTLRRVATTAVIGSAMVAGVILATVPALGANTELFDAINNSATATADKAGVKGSETSLPVVVGNIIKGALSLLGLVLVVLIIYAGWLWMSSQGDEEKIGKAKGIILNAVIGMALIFAAYAITNFVLQSVLKGATG